MFILVSLLQLENCLALGGILTFDPSSVSDGNAIADCLVQLAPDYFTSAWRGKIISETAGTWKLRVSECQLVLILARLVGSYPGPFPDFQCWGGATMVNFY